MKMKFLSSLIKKDLANKICLLRVDLNIQDAELRRTNAELRRKNFSVSQCLIRTNPRLTGILPTIEFLIKNGAKVVILSHRGRPKPAKQANAELRIKNAEFSLKPFAKILSYLLKKPVQFIDFDFLSLREGRLRRPTRQSLEIVSLISVALNDIRGQFRNSTAGTIFLLENLRFFPGEEKNDKQFAKKLASLGDIYINDAFAVSHRANASVAAITKFLPSYAGLLLEKEIKNLSSIMKNPRRRRGSPKAAKRPLVVILGGVKISDKISLIKNFLKKGKGQRSRVNCILLGGGMANTFMAAQDLPIGGSLYEEKMIPLARKFLKSNLPGRQAGKIILPIDTVVYKRQILDIGPKTIEKYSKIIENARTIIWNGPMGYIEDKKFVKGTIGIWKAILKNKKAQIVIGGGETTAFFERTRINAPACAGRDINADKRGKSKIFLSTGGGAMLEYLAGGKLPGIEALEKNKI